MPKKNQKVIRYRRPWNLNVGVIIFAVIFIYLVISVVTYLSKEQIHVYEVTSGSLANYLDYTALILRDETVSSCQNSGYVSLYVRDGRKVGIGDLVYSIDESGRVLEMLSQNDGGNSLSSDDLQDLKSEISQFSMSYDSMNFSSVYDMKNNIQTILLEYVNASALEELTSQLSESETSTFIKSYADISGIISTAVDGLEDLTPEEVTAESFDSSSYTRTLISSGQAVERGTQIYKTITDETWYLIIQLSEEDEETFQNTTSVTLSFKGSSLETTGSFEMYQGADGGTYGKITLNRYMVQFISRRYTDIEIQTRDVNGLKIPASSIVYKEFYQVPQSYMTSDGALLVEFYDEDGHSYVEKVTPVTYSTDAEYCYLDVNEYDAGLNVIMEDSNDRYILRQRAQLPGVYNVNKGYVIFRKILILDEGSEYDIISSSDSSVSIYDHIVLNGETVTEGQIIYY